MTCPNCKNEIPDTGYRCPYCNTPLPEDEIKYNRRRKANQRSPLVAGILLFFGGYIGVHNFYLGQVLIGISKLTCVLFSVAVYTLLSYGYKATQMGEILLFVLSIYFIFIPIINIKELLDLYWHKAQSKYELVYTPRNWRLLGIICIPIIGITICLCLISISPFLPILDYLGTTTSATTSKTVQTIENYEYSENVTIGDMIDGLITYPKWEIIDENTANVSGIITYNGNPATLGIGFEVTPDQKVTVYAMEMNDTPLGSLERNLILLRMLQIALTDGLQH